jgi:hypothetical protein
MMNDAKQKELEDFLSSSSPAPENSSSNQNTADNNKSGIIFESKNVADSSGGGGERVRHSIKSCNCELCQQKRLAIARKFGIVSSEADGEEELPEIDKEMMGKLLTVLHTYKATVNAVKYPEIAEIWKVSEATENSLGAFGNAVVSKWLKKANFPYKTELVLSLYISSDIGIRLLNESRIKALIDADNKLKGAVKK